jgi:hypothetical protein
VDDDEADAEEFRRMMEARAELHLTSAVLAQMSEMRLRARREAICGVAATSAAGMIGPNSRRILPGSGSKRVRGRHCAHHRSADITRPNIADKMPAPRKAT